MDRQTRESLKPGWLTPEALVEFIDELRRNGFNLGVADYIAAQDLLLMLAARGERLDHPQRAAALLGPLLCSSPAEQNAFPDYFARWVERRPPVLRDQVVAPQQTMVEALDETAKRGLRLEWILFIGVVVVLLCFSSLILINSSGEFPAQPNPTPAESTSPLPTEDEGKTLQFPALEIAGVAILLLGGASLVWMAAWRINANQFLQRRQSNRAPDIKQISIGGSDDVLFPSLTFLSIARLFRQRVHVVSQDINIVRTVEQSVEHGGWLTPAYGSFLVPPEYLVLVDRRTRFDHLAQFMETMIKRLEEHGVFITMYTFDGDPRLCFPVRGDKIPQSLTELATRYESMRLILFTEAEGLLSPTSGRLAPWTRLFNRWTHRVVLTPEPPMYWGASEDEIRREFTVLPGTEEGLAVFMRILQGEKRIDELTVWRDGALPSVLQEDPQRFLARNAPPADQIDSLLMELRKYLGTDGYIWLCACAIYPELHWRITISLGQLLKDGNKDSLLKPHTLADLARLPWFRYGTMPDWLRMRLILDLPTGQEAEVRAALEALLVTAVQGHGEALDFEIAYERREWTSRLARSLLRVLRRKAPHDSPIQDRVFLDFMLRRWNLAVRVPEALRRQLLAPTGSRSGWKLLFKGRGAIALLPASGPTSFFRLWRNVLTHPNEQTFAVIAASPNAKVTTAFLWIFIGGLINSLVWFLAAGFIFDDPTISPGVVIFSVLLLGGLIGLIYAVFFAVGSAIVHWIARLFGGKGTFNQLSYTFGAITAPILLISTVSNLLSAIPLAGLCFSMVSLVAGLYVLVLLLMAVKGVHKFGWGPAAGSVLLPVAFLCFCSLVGLIGVLGPMIGNTFSSINNSLP